MIYVLWDASDIWGPLALWGLSGLDVPFKAVRAADIANGSLEREGARKVVATGCCQPSARRPAS